MEQASVPIFELVGTWRSSRRGSCLFENEGGMCDRDPEPPETGIILFASKLDWEMT